MALEKETKFCLIKLALLRNQAAHLKLMYSPIPNNLAEGNFHLVPPHPLYIISIPTKFFCTPAITTPPT